MGDVVGLSDYKNKSYSLAVNLSQLAGQILPHASGEVSNPNVIKAIEVIAEGLLALLVLLPEKVELDCKLAELSNVILVDSPEKAQEAMNAFLENRKSKLH
jgi:hypothetical protein